MGTADETAKQSKLSTMQSTQKRKPGSKPNGGFLSFRGKKPNVSLENVGASVLIKISSCLLCGFYRKFVLFCLESQNG